jgi:hypothetical protein
MPGLPAAGGQVLILEILPPRFGVKPVVRDAGRGSMGRVEAVNREEAGDAGLPGGWRNQSGYPVMAVDHVPLHLPSPPAALRDGIRLHVLDSDSEAGLVNVAKFPAPAYLGD